MLVTGPRLHPQLRTSACWEARIAALPISALNSPGPHLPSTADSRYRWRPRMLSCTRTNRSSSGSSQAAPAARTKAATLSSSQAASLSAGASRSRPSLACLRAEAGESTRFGRGLGRLGSGARPA